VGKLEASWGTCCRLRTDDGKPGSYWFVRGNSTAKRQIPIGTAPKEEVWVHRSCGRGSFDRVV
jgi:hypothetical protein